MTGCVLGLFGDWSGVGVGFFGTGVSVGDPGDLFLGGVLRLVLQGVDRESMGVL